MKVATKFNEYDRLYEADKNDETIVIVSQIMATFFNAYSALLPLAEDYKDIIKDLENLIDSEETTSDDPTGKVKAMEEMIEKVISAVDNPEYKKVLPDFKKASDGVIKAYISVIGQFGDEDKEIRKVINTVSKSAVRFTTSLKTAKKEVRESLLPTPEGKYEKALFEARNAAERRSLLDDIVSAKGNLGSLLKTPGLRSLSSAVQNLIDELDTMKNRVQSEDHWQGKKRKERKEELQQMAERIAEIPNEIASKQMQLLRKLGSNKEAMEDLNQARQDLDSARQKLSDVTSAEIKDMKPTEEEEKDAAKELGDKEESTDKKEDKASEKKEYKNIDPDDIENMQKKGPNRETIKDYQMKINMILKDDKEYKEISTDGLYGKNTKSAVSELQKALNKLGAGLNTKGILTAQTQKSIDGFIENKEEIAGMLKTK